MLSGLKIQEEIKQGNIVISPYNEEQLNPNSYNLRLHDELLVYDVDEPIEVYEEFIEGKIGDTKVRYYIFLNGEKIYISDEQAKIELSNHSYLDMAKDNPTKSIKIPKEGFILQPGELYLGRTVEHTETKGYIPMLDGRSSIGRLGIDVHITAGFGDVGFKGFWTLELRATKPVKVYPGVEICQISYHNIDGEYETYSSGKYQDNKEVQASKLYQEF